MTPKQFKTKLARIQKEKNDLLNSLSKSKFGTRRHLLWVVKQVYRNVLDECAGRVNPETKRRLNKKEQFILGQNLVRYWNLKK